MAASLLRFSALSDASQPTAMQKLPRVAEKDFKLRRYVFAASVVKEMCCEQADAPGVVLARC
jgi:hypothetical protein